jgi:hypothetical protein
MEKIYDLKEWKFNKKVPGNERIASVRILLTQNDFKKVINLTPGERVSAADKHYRDSFLKLLQKHQFDKYKVIGNKKRPSGIETNILTRDLKKLAKLKIIGSIFINSVHGGKKIIEKEQQRFFCIKMTVAIQIEGVKKGLQTYEQRYVLIKATSFDEAYRKMERQTKKYMEPYLNYLGQLVRWKIESLDDCYETFISNCDDLNLKGGAEVFSVLKKRKLTKERFWNGKL